MKYLKSYEYVESNIDKKCNYNVGDIVVCVETVKGLPSMHNKETEIFTPILSDLITKGEKYKVKDIKNINNKCVVDVTNVETGKNTINLSTEYFISEEEYNAKKINI